MANKKAEILTMDGQVVSPITLATNVLLDDGRTAQDLLDSRDESMFSPTITTSSSISKVGQGDNVDFSENIIDGAYKSCVLKGKTLVNHNAEGNNRNEYACMPSLEGSNLTVNGTVESKVKSAILKGQTLVNYVKLNSKITSANAINIQNISVDNTKKYLLKLRINEIPEFTYDSDVQLALKIQYFSSSSLDGFTSISNIDLQKNYELIKIINPTTVFDTNGLFTLWMPRYISGTLDIDIMFIPYQDGMENWDIPYFEGMQSVKLPVLTTTGKNLFDDNTVFKQGYVNYMTGGITITSNATDMITDYIPFSSTGEFAISYDGDRRVDVVCYDSNKNYINGVAGNGSVVTITEKTAYIVVMVRNISNVKNRVQIEKGTQATTYEPYKSNILTVNEDVELRGIGEVKDELDLTTGELTQRIGEIILNGSETWTKGTNNSNDESSLFYTSSQNGKGGAGSVISNNFKSIDGYTIDYGTDGIYLDHSSDINIRISNSKLVSNDVNGFKTWLQSNPTTIQYKIATESIKTVDLSDNVVYSYKDTTHYTCSSEDVSLIPTLTIEEGVKYKAIIKPSTKYSVVFNRTEVASGLTVDLGGATVNVLSTTVGKNIVQITTPPTLSHNYVIFKGLGNVIKDVQVIEGDVADDVEYFEGMCDVKNPVMTNCNMLDVDGADYKSNTISTNEVILRSLPNGVCDTLDLETGVYVQRIGEREYQVGDESNSQVLTDKVNTQYELATPITTTIDLKQHPFAYKDGYVVLTSSSEEISLTPAIEYSLIANRLGQIQSNQKLVEKQKSQIDELESMVVANLVNTQYQQALNEIKLGVK